MNPVAERLLGGTERALRGASIHAILHGHGVAAALSPTHDDDCPLQAALRAASRAGRGVTDVEDVFVRRDGTALPVSYSASPIADKGYARGLILVFRDRMGWPRGEGVSPERALQARTRQQAAVAELGQHALANADLATLMDEAVALVARTIAVDLCALLELLPDGTALRFRATSGWQAEAREQGRVPTGSASQAGYALQVGAPVIVADFRAETRFRANDLLRAHGAVSGMTVIVPGHEHDRPYGILSVHTRRVRRFTPDDIHFLTAVGNVLAAAIERARAYETLEQRVAERTRELSALLDVSHTVASTLELEPLLGLILDQLKTVVDYTGAAILLADGEHLRVLDYRGPLPREHMVGRRFPVDQAPSYRQFLHNGGRATTIDDVWGEGSLARAYQRSTNTPRDPSYHYIRSLLVVPLAVKDRLIGAVRIDHKRPRAYTPRHADLAVAFATQAAVAIENARLYGRAQEAAILEERQRLARDLHDSVTQALYGATLYAEAAARLLAAGDHVAATAHVRDVGHTTQEALREMRLLLFELRPQDLARDGLAAALRARLAAVEGRVPGLSAVVEAQDDIALSSTVEEALYGVAREALNNALKHAGARQVRLSLRREHAAVALEIVDDGGGFDPATVAHGGGFGLRGMAERMAQVGGMLAVRSAPGQGTVVRAEAPP